MNTELSLEEIRQTQKEATIEANNVMLEALKQAQSFILEITKIDGKYSYLNSRMNGTVIISDAYSALHATESAIAKAKEEQS
jgi:hypothetical protein